MLRWPINCPGEDGAEVLEGANSQERYAAAAIVAEAYDEARSLNQIELELMVAENVIRIADGRNVQWTCQILTRVMKCSISPGIMFKLRIGATLRSSSDVALIYLLDRRPPQTWLTPLLQGKKSVTRSSSARNGPMPIAAKASLKTSRVLATSARAASARATERSEGCISANSSA